jgi:hypothetical protein
MAEEVNRWFTRFARQPPADMSFHPFGVLKCANGCADRRDVDISNVALNGLQRAEVKLEKAATRIASFGADSSAGTNTDTVDLSAEMVAVMSAKTEFSANLKSLEAASQEQKSLIDLTA